MQAERPIPTELKLPQKGDSLITPQRAAGGPTEAGSATRFGPSVWEPIQSESRFDDPVALYRSPDLPILKCVRWACPGASGEVSLPTTDGSSWGSNGAFRKPPIARSDGVFCSFKLQTMVFGDGRTPVCYPRSVDAYRWYERFHATVGGDFAIDSHRESARFLGVQPDVNRLL